jgi:hypothetical protein
MRRLEENMKLGEDTVVGRCNEDVRNIGGSWDVDGKKKMGFEEEGREMEEDKGKMGGRLEEDGRKMGEDERKMGGR